MARHHSALLLACALLAVAQLIHAEAPSMAEEFWHTVLPDYELPDALRWYLQPDTTSSESTAEGTGAGGDTTNAAVDNTAELLARQWPYYYYRGATPHKSFRHSHMPAAGDNRDNKVNHSAVFFFEESVQVGRSLPFVFPRAKRAQLGMFPRHIAETIPFSMPALPGLLALLRVPAGSAQADDMEETLSLCEAPPAAEEPKFCATSLEAQLEGVMAALGSRDIRPVMSELPRSGAPWRRYAVRAVRPVAAGAAGQGFVGCHEVVYPYTVYRCHDTGLARLYMVDLEGNRGSLVTVAVICHNDTSQWDPDHPSFELLGTKPGGLPICHTLSYGHIMWTKNDGDYRSSA